MFQKDAICALAPLTKCAAQAAEYGMREKAATITITALNNNDLQRVAPYMWDVFTSTLAHTNISFGCYFILMTIFLWF